MKKIIILPIFAAFVLFFSFFVYDAHATGGTVSDGPSCIAIGGTWDAILGTCTIPYLTINSGENLTVNSGIILQVHGNVTINSGSAVFNNGNITSGGPNLNHRAYCDTKCTITISHNSTIINSGIIIDQSPIINRGNLTNNVGATIKNGNHISNFGGNFINLGIVDMGGIINRGTITNYGLITQSNTIINYPFSTLTNVGTIDSIGYINNLAKLTNFGNITNSIPNSLFVNNVGGNINNSGTIKNLGNIKNLDTINNSGPINNSGQINNTGILNEFCKATITGNLVIGNPAVNLCDTTKTTAAPNPSVISIGTAMTIHVRVVDTNSGTKTLPTGNVIAYLAFGNNYYLNFPLCTLTSRITISDCTFTYTPLFPDSQIKIIADYEGDSTHQGSNGVSSFIVTLRNTTTIVTPNPATTNIGQKMSFHVNVADTNTGTKSLPTGLVTWSDGGAGGKFSPSSTCTLIQSTSISVCAVSYTPSSTGPVTITATYSGDSAHRVSLGTSALTVS